MPVDVLTLFFALLAVALVGLMIATGVSAVVDGPDRLGLRSAVRSLGREGAAAVAVVATFGSLYLSEVAGYVPCRLCWVQRGFMYPAAVLLVVGLVTRARWTAMAAAALALPGLAVAVFHRWEQSVGDVAGVCDPAVPCSSRWVDHFGFVTIPTMAAVGFAGVLFFIALTWRSS